MDTIMVKFWQESVDLQSIWINVWTKQWETPQREGRPRTANQVQLPFFAHPSCRCWEMVMEQTATIRHCGKYLIWMITGCSLSVTERSVSVLLIWFFRLWVKIKRWEIQRPHFREICIRCQWHLIFNSFSTYLGHRKNHMGDVRSLGFPCYTGCKGNVTSEQP